MSDKRLENLPLFLEDIYDALRAAVQALGGAKKVASQLWPHKSLDQAHKELLDCLNRENVRKFDAEEILALLRMANDAQFHQAKHWIDHATGYRNSEPLDPIIERDRLADSLDAAAKSFDALKQTAERLITQAPDNVKAIRR